MLCKPRSFDYLCWRSEAVWDTAHPDLRVVRADIASSFGKHLNHLPHQLSLLEPVTWHLLQEESRYSPRRTELGLMNIYSPMAELGRPIRGFAPNIQLREANSDGTFGSSEKRVTQLTVVRTTDENKELPLSTIFNYESTTTTSIVLFSI
jgi:hypothetical protein